MLNEKTKIVYLQWQKYYFVRKIVNIVKKIIHLKIYISKKYSSKKIKVINGIFKKIKISINNICLAIIGYILETIKRIITLLKLPLIK